MSQKDDMKYMELRQKICSDLEDLFDLGTETQGMSKEEVFDDMLSSLQKTIVDVVVTEIK